MRVLGVLASSVFYRVSQFQVADVPELSVRNF